MAILVTDCPRCGASAMTLDVTAQLHIGQDFGWVDFYELFSICRNCKRSTTFVVSLRSYEAQSTFSGKNALVSYDKSLNSYFEIRGHLSLKDNVLISPPEHVPPDIVNAFKEAARCLAVECYNASGAMFRLCVDLATRQLLPDPADTAVTQPNGKQRRDLGLRLAWLFDNNRLPTVLQELAKCVREDGNDGAHVGSLTKTDAEDLLDFTTSLLERLFTEPERLRLAESRRIARRTQK